MKLDALRLLAGIKREIEMREGGRLRAHPHMHGMPADFDVVDIARGIGFI